MHKQLIIAAFEKAKAYAELEGSTNPSKSYLATLLADFINEKVKFSISERRLRDYYNEAIVIETESDINIAQQAVINGLCLYIDYESYQAFLNANASKPKECIETIANLPKKLSKLSFLKKHKTAVLSILAVIVLVIIIVKINQQHWMVWNGEVYEQVSYNSKLLQNGTLKLYNKERIENFRKLKNINCDTEFFNADNSVKVWYGKNKDGGLECFSSYGLHPETGKTLKPISVHMIRKYLCETY